MGETFPPAEYAPRAVASQYAGCSHAVTMGCGVLLPSVHLEEPGGGPLTEPLFLPPFQRNHILDARAPGT